MSREFAESGSGGGATPRGDDFGGRAIATGARVRFVEDSALLAEMGGVAATLRYKPGAAPRDNSPVERKVEA
jgi:hypothetical protein